VKSVSIIGVNTSALLKYSNEETINMLAEIKKGNKEVREKFITANMRLVLSVIQRYIRAKHCSDDVFQIGCIGLIKAIDNFDPNFNVKFSTYAVPMIIGEIRRFLRDENGLRISRSMRDTAYRVIQMSQELEKKLNREPTIDEMAAATGEKPKDIYFALMATGNLFSLDDKINDDNDGDSISIMQTIEADNISPDTLLENRALKTAIKNLAKKEREILLKRYFIGKTQIEVSEEIGISQAQVSRLEKNALKEIKQKL
jgi:RNA polymerase sporulation-specific sigma factor